MINKNKILLLECSSDKDLTPEQMPASDRYTGSLFRPLVEHASIGKMVQAAQFLLKDPGLRSGRGVVATLYKELITGKRTKQELKLLLRSRIGDERNSILRQDGEYFWLEKR